MSVLPPHAYPIAGIVYFITHPQLWTKTICPFLLTLVAGIASLVFSFAFLLPLQSHALININCPIWLAWLVSLIFVVFECAIFTSIFFAIILPIFQDALFDATLKSRDLQWLFDQKLEIGDLVLCCRGTGAGLLLALFFILARILFLIITMPLHLIPVVGTIINCYVNGWIACWGLLIHYDIELRGFTVKESRQYAWGHRSDYLSFGVVAVALELIPVANLFFMFTNIVGAALWVADQVVEETERTRQHHFIPAPGLPNAPPPLSGADLLVESNQPLLDDNGQPLHGYGSTILFNTPSVRRSMRGKPLRAAYHS